MRTEMDPVFSAALRNAVIEQAKPSRRTSSRRGTRTTLISLTTVATVGIAGVTAASLMGSPGQELETQLGDSFSVTAQGQGELDLGPARLEADAVHFEFECLSVGSFALGHQGLAVSCSEEDEGRSVASGLMPMEALTDSAIVVATEAEARWRLTAWFVSTDRVPLAVNERGETYGIDSDQASPDLIQAVATNGETGYVRRTELDQSGGPVPTSPAEAAIYSPEDSIISVYERDGTTVIGEFLVSATG